MLCAFMLFGPRLLRPSVPAAIIVHFLGGIHEIYFPYVLMKPKLILAMIAGGMSGVATFMVTDAGLVATPAPGSIFAYFAVTPKGSHFGMILGILVSAAVSFAVASVLLGFGRKEPAIDAEEDDAGAAFDQAKADSDARHAAAKSNAPATTEV
jgi:PTS system mannitol-specific IIC component